MIVSPNGVVITNNHVIELGSQGAARQITVTRRPDPVLAANLVGTNSQGRRGLKIDSATDLPTITFRNSSDRRSAMPSWRSATRRSRGRHTDGHPGHRLCARAQGDRGGESSETETLYSMMQTDAAINPGNSGGPAHRHRARSSA